jgi:hypothetical protein
VIGTIEGVDLLSNPPIPRHAKGVKWGMPSSGSTFGAAPGPKVSIEHVDQGVLGDCWDVSSMGAIAHRKPEVFEGMVKDVDDKHVIVHFPERSVAVTKELPMLDGSPAFGGSKPDDPVYWPAYVEKAQAAIRPGGYKALEGGNSWRAFHELLGTEPVQGSSAGSVFDDALRLGRDKPPMTMSTKDPARLSSAAKERMEALQVFDDHSYVAKDITDEGADLYNPWGRKHPNGPLSREDVNAIFDGVDTPTEYTRLT